jgi:hypothetical protein
MTTNKCQIKMLVVAVAAVAFLCIGQSVCSGGSILRKLTAGDTIVDANASQNMLVLGYDGGRLEFRNWQGNVLTTRTGFGEITAIESYRCGSSPLPRLLVASTDSGGALRVIDPANISGVVVERFGLGRITAISAWVDDVYIGSADSGGSLRKIDNITLADEVVRTGLGNITALEYITNNAEPYLLMANTDSGGTLRIVNPDTLADEGLARSGLGTIYALAAEDINWDGTSEIVVASSDTNGTVRYIGADNLFLDRAVRSGFSGIYDVEYGLLGAKQCSGNGRASIVVASSERKGGAIHLIEVDTVNINPTLADSAVRCGLDKVASIKISDLYNTGIGVLQVFSMDGGTMAVHIMDEHLVYLTAGVKKSVIPAFIINRLSVKKGVVPGFDSITATGMIDISDVDIVRANNVRVNIWSAADVNEPLYSESINLPAGISQKGLYSYAHRILTNQAGSIASFYLNWKKHTFLLYARNIDLTGLTYPLSIEITAGSYTSRTNWQ